MISRTAFAPAKVILSGEYAVVYGYPGIAIPADVGITATYTEDLGSPDLKLLWDGVHEKWMEYALEIADYCRKQDDQLFGTLTIECSAPLGKGMGSSTAVVIAIARAILGEDCEEVARHIEDEVNPGHSGIDFTTIWHNSPIEFRKGEEPKFIRLEEDLLESMELIDTSKPNATTAELVAWMDSRQEEVAEALHTIGNCSERIIKGEDVKEVMRDHHRAQVALGVVPEEVHNTVKAIEDNGGAAKVLGAGAKTGGAGMILVINGKN